MSRSFRSMIERQIRKAQADGAFDDLEGAGKPLPDRSADTLADPGLAVGLRMMAEAGVTPEEFALKAELSAARHDYQAATDPVTQKTAMARIAELEMRYNMARDARRAFFR
ncbi:MAG: DUF1992 domain-containing protein [Pseudomonadota bacterium]